MPTTNYLSAVTYEDVSGDLAGVTDLNIAFPYLDRAHINVYRDGVALSRPSAWDFFDSSTVRLAAPVGTDETIVVRRITKLDARMVDFSNGSNLTEEDLNVVTKQLLYLIQEISDVASSLEDGGSGLPGGSPLDQDDIDAIITELFQRQTFLDLIALIPLVDINAEAIISEQLENHEQWSLGRERDYLRNITNDLAEANSATIDVIESVIVTNESATATLITALTARMDNAESDIVTVSTAYAAADLALSIQITGLSSRVDTNEADVVTLLATTATQDSAIATLQTEVSARIRTSDLEAELALSSYINGVVTSVNDNGSSISTMESWLVGVNGDIENPQNGSIADNVSLLQIVANGHTNQLGTEFAFRQSMASRFGSPDPNDVSALAAAIEESWQTYADSESALAAQFTTLQANTKPIFTSPNPPSPLDPLYNAANAEWATEGFPQGSMWFKQTGTSNEDRWKIQPFWWVSGDITGLVAEGEEFHSYNRPSDNQYIGSWVPAKDQDLLGEVQGNGASIDTVASALTSGLGSAASMSTRLQAIFGPNITNIEEWLDAYILPPLGQATGGLMYSGYGVRMNQYLGGGSPVIAGFSLGIQSDPWNPDGESVSDMIVMADNFAVIAPPTAGSFIDGVLDVSTVSVPFIIDTVNNRVGIDGDLTVNGTLRAYLGGLKDINVGRATFTQLDANLDPISPSGMRLQLMSSTEGYWTSGSASPFPGGSNPQEFFMWAGSGTMNHNNALFYLDTDGNGFFSGQVSADNIAGDLSSGTSVDVGVAPVVAINDTTWMDLGTPQVLSSSSARGKKPMAMVNLLMYGAGQFAGEGRLQIAYETSPSSWSSWFTVAQAAVGLEYGTNLSLSGGLDIAGNYGFRVRCQFRGFNGYTPTSTGYSGALFALS